MAKKNYIQVHITANLELFKEQVKIMTFDEFVKWFAKNYATLTCSYSFRNILAKNGLYCKKDTQAKNRWTKGFYT
jgi:hypothetical protein